nr:hypothetical protein [Bacteroidales bacterium]
VWYRGLGWGGVDYYNLQYPVYTVGDVPHLHSWFLEILFACGLFVFCFYGWVYVRTWWVNLRLVVEAGRHFRDASGLCGGAVFDAGRVTAVRQAVVATATLSGFVALSMASSSFVPAQWFWAVGALGFGAAGLSPAPVSSVEKGAGVADNRAGYQAGNKARKKRL